jgi:hypothetical protein
MAMANGQWVVTVGVDGTTGKEPARRAWPDRDEARDQITKAAGGRAGARGGRGRDYRDNLVWQFAVARDLLGEVPTSVSGAWGTAE